MRRAGWRRGGALALDCSMGGSTDKLTSLQVGRERRQLQRGERGDPGTAALGRRKGKVSHVIAAGEVTI